MSEISERIKVHTYTIHFYKSKSLDCDHARVLLATVSVNCTDSITYQIIKLHIWERDTI